MGLGPHGDGRAGPAPRWTDDHSHAFGSLLVGGWRRGPPSASAGPPRLRAARGLRATCVATLGLVRAADGRGLGRRLFYRSPRAGLCRSASDGCRRKPWRSQGPNLWRQAQRPLAEAKVVGAVEHALGQLLRPLDKCPRAVDQAGRWPIIQAESVPAFKERHLGPHGRQAGRPCPHLPRPSLSPEPPS